MAAYEEMDTKNDETPTSTTRQKKSRYSHSCIYATSASFWSDAKSRREQIVTFISQKNGRCDAKYWTSTKYGNIIYDCGYCDDVSLGAVYSSCSFVSGDSTVFNITRSDNLVSCAPAVDLPPSTQSVSNFRGFHTIPYNRDADRSSHCPSGLPPSQSASTTCEISLLALPKCEKPVPRIPSKRSLWSSQDQLAERTGGLNYFSLPGTDYATNHVERHAALQKSLCLLDIHCNLQFGWNRQTKYLFIESASCDSKGCLSFVLKLYTQGSTTLVSVTTKGNSVHSQDQPESTPQPETPESTTNTSYKLVTDFKSMDVRDVLLHFDRVSNVNGKLILHIALNRDDIMRSHAVRRALLQKILAAYGFTCILRSSGAHIRTHYVVDFCYCKYKVCRKFSFFIHKVGVCTFIVCKTSDFVNHPESDGSPQEPYDLRRDTLVVQSWSEINIPSVRHNYLRQCIGQTDNISCRFSFVHSFITDQGQFEETAACMHPHCKVVHFTIENSTLDSPPSVKILTEVFGKEVHEDEPLWGLENSQIPAIENKGNSLGSIPVSQTQQEVNQEAEGTTPTEPQQPTSAGNSVSSLEQSSTTDTSSEKDQKDSQKSSLSYERSLCAKYFEIDKDRIGRLVSTVKKAPKTLAVSYRIPLPKDDWVLDGRKRNRKFIKLLKKYKIDFRLKDGDSLYFEGICPFYEPEKTVLIDYTLQFFSGIFFQCIYQCVCEQYELVIGEYLCEPTEKDALNDTSDTFPFDTKGRLTTKNPVNLLATLGETLEGKLIVYSPSKSTDTDASLSHDYIQISNDLTYTFLSSVEVNNLFLNPKNVSTLYLDIAHLPFLQNGTLNTTYYCAGVVKVSSSAVPLFEIITTSHKPRTYKRGIKNYLEFLKLNFGFQGMPINEVIVNCSSKLIFAVFESLFPDGLEGYLNQAFDLIYLAKPAVFNEKLVFIRICSKQFLDMVAMRLDSFQNLTKKMKEETLLAVSDMIKCEYFADLERVYIILIRVLVSKYGDYGALYVSPNGPEIMLDDTLYDPTQRSTFCYTDLLDRCPNSYVHSHFLQHFKKAYLQAQMSVTSCEAVKVNEFHCPQLAKYLTSVIMPIAPLFSGILKPLFVKNCREVEAGLTNTASHKWFQEVNELVGSDKELPCDQFVHKLSNHLSDFSKTFQA